MDSCGLCKAYNEDYRVVYRNEDAVSVVIQNPVNNGHLMILPKRHILTLEDLTADESKAVNEILYKSQQRLSEVFPEHPPILAMQTGRHSTQPHIHYQMFPSDGNIRKLYGAAHNKPHELVSIDVSKDITHPYYEEITLQLIAEKLR